MIPLLHERLPALRRERGFSQGDLADRCADVSLDTIRKYEQRSRAGVVPEVEILEDLAAAFDLAPIDAFYEYPIAAARRAARPGVSQRRRPNVNPSEAASAIERAAQQHSEQRSRPGSSRPPRRRKAQGG